MRVCDVTGDDVTARGIVCINQLIDEDEARVIRANAVYDDVGTPLDVGLLRGQHGFLDGLFDGGGGSYSAAAAKRRVAAADDWSAACSPAKVARQTDRMFDDSCLMSMPSPPLSHGSNPTGPEFPMSCGSAGGVFSASSRPADGFVGATTESPFIPDSFLTPNASPGSFGSSPTPVYHPILMSEQNDWNADLALPAAEELSFFDHVAHHNQTIKPSVVFNGDKLPELDLPTVTSYLYCLEQSSDPLMQTAPVGGQQGGSQLQGGGGIEYPRALPVTGAVGATLAQQKTSTLDEELLQNLFSTAHTFLSSVTTVKPFDFSGSDLVFAQC